MSTLDTNPRLEAPDDIYAMLVDAHRGLSDAESERLNVRLVLLLANHIGDAQVIAEAIAAATATVRVDAPVAH
jgi:hypothetical protein